MQAGLSSTGNKLEFDAVKEALLTLYPRGSPLSVQTKGPPGGKALGKRRPPPRGPGLNTTGVVDPFFVVDICRHHPETAIIESFFCFWRRG